MDDDRDGVRWLSYAELAEIRGISKASAARLAFRRKWQRQGSNEGTARVAVPLAELQASKPPRSDGTPDDTPDDTHDDMGDDTPDDHRLIMALEARLADKDAHIATLHAALAGAEARAGRIEERADARIDMERERADRAEARTAELRDRADALRAELSAAEAAAASARAEVEAERTLGILARIGRALRRP